MEKLCCPIGVIWEPYRGPMGTLSYYIRFLWDLYHILQGPNAKLSCPMDVLWEPYRGPMGTRSSSIRFLWDLHPVLQGHYGKVILSYWGPMGTI